MREKEILKKIRKVRIEENKTLKDMSKLLGYKSISTYGKKELGLSPLTLKEYINICIILNKSLSFFFKRKLS